jgi:hypothetical protein
MIDPFTGLSEDDQAELDRQMAAFAFDGLIEGGDGTIFEIGEQTGAADRENVDRNADGGSAGDAAGRPRRS